MAEPLEVRSPAWSDDAVVGPGPCSSWTSGYSNAAVPSSSRVFASKSSLRGTAPDDLRARVLDLVPMAILCLDPLGGALLVNAAWTNLTGRSVDAELGDGWRDAFPPDDRPEITACIRAAVQEPRVLTTDVWTDTVIGRRLLRFAGQPTIDPVGVSMFVLCASDVTEQVALEERLAHDAHHDSLTGLTNRGGFVEAVERLTADAVRTGRINALLVLDLDGFKVINDAGGHGVGDQVLQLVAERIQEAVRPTDVVARLGGDEFAVVVVDIRSGVEAQALATRILRRVAEPMTIGSHDWRVGASIGVSFTTDDRVDELRARADASLYSAKALGKGRIVIENRCGVPAIPEPRSNTSFTAPTPLPPPPLRALDSSLPRVRPFHAVHFYHDADDLLPSLVGYVGAGLLDAGSVRVLATPMHRRLLNERLGKPLLDEARALGRYMEFDASETLKRIMRGGYPDPDLFNMVVGTPLLRSIAKYGRVRAYGEMVGWLWNDGNAAAALRLEDLWNDLQERAAFPLLCAYQDVGDAGDGREQIMRRHSSSLNAGT